MLLEQNVLRNCNYEVKKIPYPMNLEHKRYMHALMIM